MDMVSFYAGGFVMAISIIGTVVIYDCYHKYNKFNKKLNDEKINHLKTHFKDL